MGYEDCIGEAAMNAKLSSISVFQTYGVSRAHIRDQLYFNPIIPESSRHCLSDYYLLYWNPLHYLTENRHGFITRDEGIYTVMLDRRVSLDRIMLAKQVRLSFRKAMPEFELPGIVFVSLPT